LFFFTNFCCEMYGVIVIFLFVCINFLLFCFVFV
jgi:hypothetical protein